MLEKPPCQKIRKNLDEYLQGGMKDENRSVISTHLAECSSCRQYYSELKYLNSLLAGKIMVASPVGLSESIMAAVIKVKANKDLSWLDFAINTLLLSLALIFITIIGVTLKVFLQYGSQGPKLKAEGYFQNSLMNLQLYYEGFLNFGRKLWGEIYYWPGQISGLTDYVKEFYFQGAGWLSLAAVVALFCTVLASWALLRQVNRHNPII